MLCKGPLRWNSWNCIVSLLKWRSLTQRQKKLMKTTFNNCSIVMINKGAAATALYAFKKRDFIKGKQVLRKEHGSQTSHPYRKIITDRSTSLRKDRQGQREVSLPLRHVWKYEFQSPIYLLLFAIGPDLYYNNNNLHTYISKQIIKWQSLNRTSSPKGGFNLQKKRAKRNKTEWNLMVILVPGGPSRGDTPDTEGAGAITAFYL